MTTTKPSPQYACGSCGEHSFFVNTKLTDAITKPVLVRCYYCDRCVYSDSITEAFAAISEKEKEPRVNT